MTVNDFLISIQGKYDPFERIVLLQSIIVHLFLDQKEFLILMLKFTQSKMNKNAYQMSSFNLAEEGMLQFKIDGTFPI